jgi:magnesium-transporting ATPase (P-type)
MLPGCWFAAVQEKTHAHLEQASQDGLRTLVWGGKPLDIETFTEWNKRYEMCKKDICELQARRKAEPSTITDCIEEMEDKVEVFGMTAIEDKLQDDVPHTIHQLAKAGVKIWMLTGDKEDTAENIGFATTLLDEEMQVWV